jgi:hypothetical protein
MDLNQYIAEADGLVKKWGETLASEDAPKIRDSYRLVETAKMLEQQAAFNRAYSHTYGAPLMEDGSATSTPNMAIWDPVLVSMVRRAAPVLMAYDFAGVQTMTQPTGLVFCMYSRYTDKNGNEALFNEPDTAFTGRGNDFGLSGGAATTARAGDLASDPFASLYTTGRGMPTSAAEGDIGPEVTFTIDKFGITAVERQLKGGYSIEMQQDLRAVHNLDADSEIAKIMSNELLGEINREFIRTLFIVAQLGAAGTQTAGTYDLDADADGRWAVEKYKGLLTQISKEANVIGRATRRGLGNKIIASPDTVTMLHLTGMLDTAGISKLNAEMGGMDFTKSTMVGRLLGQFDVHVDPYVTSNALLVGYRGAEAWDAGIYYCPYVPFQMFRATDPKSFQPRMAYKTRYALAQNPFVKNGGTSDGQNLTPLSNQYFRKFLVTGF